MAEIAEKLIFWLKFYFLNVTGSSCWGVVFECQSQWQCPGNRVTWQVTQTLAENSRAADTWGGKRNGKSYIVLCLTAKSPVNSYKLLQCICAVVVEILLKHEQFHIGLSVTVVLRVSFTWFEFLYLFTTLW